VSVKIQCQKWSGEHDDLKYFQAFLKGREGGGEVNLLSYAFVHREHESQI